MTFERRILICNRDIGDKQRFAYRLTAKRRSLLEPRTRRGRAPQRLPPRVLQRPAHRFVIVIHGEVIAGVELQTVTVGITDVKEECVGDAVAAGPALDVLEEAAGGHTLA